MFLEGTVTARGTAGMAEQIRGRIAVGAPVREVNLMDMPLWLFREMEQDRPITGIFLSGQAGLVVYEDGSRTLRRIPG